MVNFNPKFTKITTPAGDPALEISDVPRAYWKHTVSVGFTVKDIFLEVQRRISGIRVVWSSEEDKPSMSITVIRRDALRPEEEESLNTFLNAFRRRLLAFISVHCKEGVDNESPRSSLVVIPLHAQLHDVKNQAEARRKLEALSRLRSALRQYLLSRGFKFNIMRIRDTGSRPKATYVDFCLRDLPRAAVEVENFVAAKGETLDEAYRVKLILPTDNEEGMYLLILEKKGTGS